MVDVGIPLGTWGAGIRHLTLKADIDALVIGSGFGVFPPPFFATVPSPANTAPIRITFFGVSQYLVGFDMSAIRDTESVCHASLNLRLVFATDPSDLSLAIACDAFPWGVVPGDAGSEDYTQVDQPGDDGLISLSNLPEVGELIKFPVRRGRIGLERELYRFMLVGGPASPSTSVIVSSVNSDDPPKLEVAVRNRLTLHEIEKRG